MKSVRGGVAALTLGFALAFGAAYAQAPTVTATCKDGTSYSGTSRSGACARHGGVKEWGTAAAPGQPVSPAPTTAPSSTTPPSPAAAARSGQVWVNTASHVYHCPGDVWYGKTKKGEYMTESEAIAKGNHADHGKACANRS